MRFLPTILIVLLPMLLLAQAFTLNDPAFNRVVSRTLPSGCVLWVRGESNIVSDISWLSATNANTSTGTIAYGAGRVGTALNFTNAASSINFTNATGSASNCPAPSSNMTVEAWIFLRSYTLAGKSQSGWVVAARGVNAASSIDWTFGDGEGNNKLSVNLQNASGWQTATALNQRANTAVTTNVWHHVAFTYDQNLTTQRTKIYLDGVQDGYMNHNTNLIQDGSATHGIIIGNYVPTAYKIPPDGLIDDLAIYNRALSSNEINAIYNLGPAGKIP
jgi:hypothetical protein